MFAMIFNVLAGTLGMAFAVNTVQPFLKELRDRHDDKDGPPAATTTPVSTRTPPAEPEKDFTGHEITEPTNDGGQTGSVPENSDNPIGVNTGLGGDFFAQAVAGRVTKLEIGTENLARVELLEKPAYGNMTVNPDNSIAVVLSGTTDTSDLRVSVRLTFKDGTTEDRVLKLDVTPGEQAAGWGKGSLYMLETDAAGDLIVDTGDLHRKVHVSGDQDALTLSDIAALEGFSNLSAKEWTAFFLNNPDYGSTPEMALAEDAGNVLWKALVDSAPEGHSHWLLLESGHTYHDMQFLYGKGGESELHPMYVGAYGEGDRPVVDYPMRLVARAENPSENIVLDGITIAGGGRFMFTENIILNDVIITGDEVTAGAAHNFTVRDSHIYDVVRDKPVTNDEIWLAHPNRISGFYMSGSDGVLFENNFFGQNGWADGYDYHLSTSAPQAPSKFSHNLYLDSSLRDLTVRDNIILQGASSGAQLRSGGFIEDNAFIDNNGAVVFGSDNMQSNYTLFVDNLVTSGAHKVAIDWIGEVTYGITNNAMMASLVDNIVTHLADPDNEAEFIDKDSGQHALIHTVDTPHYDDTIIYNWKGSIYKPNFGLYLDQNIDGLDTTVLDETTIQNFTAKLLGQPTATISDLGDYLRGEASGALNDVVDADVINAFFKEGFGFDTTLRAQAATLRFVPNQLGDGIRWDNRMNWDSGDLPGTQNGDRVELAGNWVEYGGNTAITDLDFGDGGRLTVHYGRLTIEDHITVGDGGARLTTDGAGQFWANGYTDSDLLEISAEGGRFVNTGLWTGKTDLTASDNAQVLLATDGADYVMGAGSTLSIEGGDTKVGFDGEQGDTAVLLMGKDATVEFSATDGDIAGISEFTSGRFDDTGAGVRSGINLGESTLRVDVSGYTEAADLIELMSADELIGKFGTVEITGLGARNAVLQVDYDADRVALILGEDGFGTGAFAIETLGDEATAQADMSLYEALTNGHGIYPEDLPADIPAEEDDDAFVL